MRGLLADGNAIRQFRKKKTWTQEDTADACGCSVRTIRNAERGDRIDSRTLVGLANVLGATIESIIKPEAIEVSIAEQHVQTVRDWLDAFMTKDVERLMQFHHDDTVLELPGTYDMPAGGNFIGKQQVRHHFNTLFPTFDPVEVHDEEFDAVGKLVFHRSTMTGKNRKTGYEITARYFSEFEFKDALIIRRMTISDLTEHRRSWEEN